MVVTQVFVLLFLQLSVCLTIFITKNWRENLLLKSWENRILYTFLIGYITYVFVLERAGSLPPHYPGALEEANSTIWASIAFP